MAEKDGKMLEKFFRDRTPQAVSTLLIILHALSIDNRYQIGADSITKALVEQVFQEGSAVLAVSMAIKGFAPAQIHDMTRDDVLLAYYENMNLKDQEGPDGVVARTVMVCKNGKSFDVSRALFDWVVQDTNLAVLLTGEEIEMVVFVYEQAELFDLLLPQSSSRDRKISSLFGIQALQVLDCPAKSLA
jgi:hypothetical protein